MKRKIYLDYASTTPLFPEVADYMYKILKEEFGNPSSIHHFGRNAKAIVEQSRTTIAQYLSASVGEIFFTSGATESFHTVVYSCIRDLQIERFISSPTEHHCTLHTLANIQKDALADVEYLRVDNKGNIDLDHLIEMLSKSSKKTLLCLMHGNNEIATMHDIEKIGEICKENNTLFLCDAAQTFGKYPMDLSKLNISFLTASAHKLFAPKGIGLLYINDNNLINAHFLGGSQERNIRAGTECVHGIAGYAKAVEIAVSQMDERKKELLERKNYLIKHLIEDLQDIKFNGELDSEKSMSHILSVSFPNTEKSELLMFNLDIAGICASSGSACASGVEQDSHVLQAIGHDPLRKTIRFSFAPETTIGDLDYLIETLKKVL